MEKDKSLFSYNIKSIDEIDNDFTLATATKKSEMLRGQAINMDEFCPEVHSAEVITEHKSYLENLKAKFELGFQRNPELKVFKEYADVLEAIIYDGIKNHHWFGKDVYACLASVYDDVKHQVDMFIELPNEPQAENFSTMGLAIDATFGQEPRHKIELIMAGIKNGQLREISYYQDRHGQKMVKTDVPAAVIGADLKKLKKLMESWLEGGRSEMLVSPWQGFILNSIDKQAEMFSDFAQSQNQAKVALVYNNLREIISRIRLGQKENFEKFKDDSVYLDFDQVQSQIESDITSIAKESGCDFYVLKRQKNEESIRSSYKKQLNSFRQKIAIKQVEIDSKKLSAEQVIEHKERIKYFQKRIKEVEKLMNN